MFSFLLEEFFRKLGVAVMSVKELFDFIVDPTVTEKNMDDYLDAASKKMDDIGTKEMTAQELIDEEVHKNEYIPQNLSQVRSFLSFLYSLRTFLMEM